MLTLGIMGIDSSMYQTLVQQFESQTYSLIKVDKKEQLEQLDGLILSMAEKEEMSSIIDWLLTCRKTPAVFVWVFSTIPLEYEETILFELGANDVVMTKARESSLVHVVKNTFDRLEHSCIAQQSRDTSLVNGKNRSIIVNGTEQPLTAKEYQVFSLLYANKETTVSYSELLQELWPNGSGDETYRIANIIFHLRKKLNENDRVSIKTVRSKGYILTIKEN